MQQRQLHSNPTEVGRLQGGPRVQDGRMKKGQVQSDPTEVLPSSNRTTRRQRQPHLEDSEESDERRESDGLEKNEPKEWNAPAQRRGVRSQAGWAGNELVSEYTKPRRAIRPASRKEETRKEKTDKDSFEDEDSSEESDDFVGNSRTRGGRGVLTTQPNGENPRSPVGMPSATSNLQPLLNTQSFLEQEPMVASATQKSDTSQLRTITTAVVDDTQHPTTTGVRGDHSTHSHYRTVAAMKPMKHCCHNRQNSCNSRGSLSRTPQDLFTPVNRQA